MSSNALLLSVVGLGILVLVLVVLLVVFARKRKHEEVEELPDFVQPFVQEKDSVIVEHARIASHLASEQVEVLEQIEQIAEDPDLLFHVFRSRHLAARINYESELQQALSGLTLSLKGAEAKYASDVARNAMEAANGFENVRLQTVEDSVVTAECVPGVVNLLTQLIDRATDVERYGKVRIKVSVVNGCTNFDIIDHGKAMTDEDLSEVVSLIQAGMLDEPPARDGLWAVGAVIRNLPLEVRFTSGGNDGGTIATVSLGQDALGSVEDLVVHEKIAPISAETPAVPKLNMAGPIAPKIGQIAPIAAPTVERQSISRQPAEQTFAPQNQGAPVPAIPRIVGPTEMQATEQANLGLTQMRPAIPPLYRAAVERMEVRSTIDELRRENRNAGRRQATTDGYSPSVTPSQAPGATPSSTLPSYSGAATPIARIAQMPTRRRMQGTQPREYPGNGSRTESAQN